MTHHGSTDAGMPEVNTRVPPAVVARLVMLVIDVGNVSLDVARILGLVIAQRLVTKISHCVSESPASCDTSIRVLSRSRPTLKFASQRPQGA